MSQFENKLEVEKVENGQCFSCNREGRVTRIRTKNTNYSMRSMCLCYKCLAWLKGKLRGF